MKFLKDIFGRQRIQTLEMEVLSQKTQLNESMKLLQSENQNLRGKLDIHKGPPGPPPRVTVSRASIGRAKVGKRIYEAGQSNRLTADWGISITSANAEILVSAIATRARMRGLERDDDYMRSMLNLLENNVIGEDGIRLRMRLKKDGNKSGSKQAFDDEANQMVQDAWDLAMEEENCTPRRNLHGIEVQRLYIRALARDGALIPRKYIGFNNDFGFALHPIEIDRLDHFWSRPATGSANSIQFGVEYDELECPLAYWILTRHPGDVFAWRAGPKYRERVPAQECIPLWTIERAGQIGAMPIWPSIARRLHHLHEYENSELIASRVAAAKGGWFKKQHPQDGYAGPEDAAGNKILDTEPGQWEELPLGWDPIQNDPKHPMDAYQFFMKGQLRGASAGANLPYPAVANDLEGVNFSSIRAGLLEARSSFRWLQKVMIKKVMRNWFNSWAPMAIISGKLKFPMDRLDELKSCARWQGVRWPWVDPWKDVQADIAAIEAGLDSWRHVIEENGGDIHEVFEQLKEDKDLAEEMGLEFSIQNSIEKSLGNQPEDETAGNRPSNGENGKNGSKKNGERFSIA